MAPGEVEIDDDLAAQLDAVAAAQGETADVVIRRVLRDYVARSEGAESHAASNVPHSGDTETGSL